MPPVPSGTVTFLFTDVEGSTRLLQHLGDARATQVFEQHRRLLREAFAAGGGHELQDQGDGFLVVFSRAQEALWTAVAAQRAIDAHAWPDGVRLRVRMGLHSGEPVSTVESYVGVDVHRAARICAAGHGGQVLLSQTTQALVEYYLPAGAGLRDLGFHRFKDLQRPERVYQLLYPDLPADFPPLRSLDHFANNLPLQLTSFIGREREIAEIKQLLVKTRLLTLTGAGGAGKTRLALHVAAEVLDGFSDGVWFVDLGRLSDPVLLAQTAASALGVREEEGGRPLLDTLADFLRTRAVLLVLDNCEHLLESCATLTAGLLRAAPELRILATSREGLGIAGETVYYVPSLSLPGPEQPVSAAEVVHFEAVRLFVERAASRLPGFSVEDRNAPVVVEICRRLDGMPLAIELAAARVNTLAVDQIASRLDDRFRLLTAGDRTALPQHRTLRAVMEWSYQLLSEAEQMMLCRLAVFAGGFTLEAMEAVCGSHELGDLGAIELLARLVDRSLVVTEHGLEVRYRLLETVREYGREKLLASGELPGVRTRHRDWYMALAERAEPEILTGPNQRVWLERLGAEDANLRAALEWSHSGEHSTEVMLRLAGALVWFWFTRGQWNEALEWLRRALSRPDAASSPARAKALYGLALVQWLHGETTEAVELARQSLTMCREFGDKWGMACSIFVLGVVATERGDSDRAVTLLEEGLELFEAVGHPQGIGMAQFYLGHAVSGSDYRRATALWERSLVVLRHAGDKRGLAVVAGALGDTAWLRGDYRRATELYSECASLGRELGYKERIAYSLFGMGGVARTQGDYDRARTLIEESLAIYRQFSWKTGVGLCLRRLGMVALDRGDLAHADTRLQEALELFRALGQKSSVGDSLDALGVLARHRGALDQAVRLHEEALALFSEVRDKLGSASSLMNLGKVAQHRSDPRRAAELYAEALVTRGEFGYTLGVAEGLEALGAVAIDEQRWERAGRLFGAAQEQRDALGAILPPIDRADYDRGLAAVHAALGNAAKVILAEGRVMSLGEAIDCALRETV